MHCARMLSYIWFKISISGLDWEGRRVLKPGVLKDVICDGFIHFEK